MTLCWVDGQPSEGLSVHDRGLAYGDGLFETMRVVNGTPQLLERHLARLQLGSERLAITHDRAEMRKEILSFCAVLSNGVAKLILSRGEGQRGYPFPQPCRPRRILIGSALPAYPVANAELGINLHACTTRLAEQPLLAGLKHLNRLEQVLARAEWQDPSYAEGLMRDTSGRIVEGVFSNIFLVLEGRLLTPALTRCGVEGVMRNEIIARAEQSGISVTVEDIAYEQLLRADELFLCNSLYGIWPVRTLMDRVWPVGPLTRKLQALLAELPSAS